MAVAIETGPGGPAESLVRDVDTWIFDLDDTLYPRSAGLHEKMLARVVELIRSLTGADEDEARRLHGHYYETYGTSLVGLDRHHGVSPARFMEFVHDIDIDSVEQDDRLRPLLAALPGRRLVFTNGPLHHATRILQHLGIADLFDAICDIETCGFVGKPGDAAYETLFSNHAILPSRAIMFDDRDVNLRAASGRGIRTVLVGVEEDYIPASYIDAKTNDLPCFLSSAIDFDLGSGLCMK
jgi:putative hydrolase of the HAD superfamily